MDLPTPRELELETLLRQRDAQVVELTDEVTHLRQFLATQPPPSATEPTTIPPALMSLLLPHLNQHTTAATSGSGSATAALIQRNKTLQEENDELYNLLKIGETGRLKEDVHSLRHLVRRLEAALRESHQVIALLSTELKESQDAYLQAHGRTQPSPAPRPHQPPPHLSISNGKLPPTGPRAHKKPRLSESQNSPAASNASLPPKPHLSAANATQPRGASRDSRVSQDKKPPVENNTMDVDDDNRSRPRSPVRERDKPPHRDRGRDRDKDRDRDRGDRDRVRNRDRERNKERDKERDKDRDRDRDRASRRNGGGGSGGAGSGGGSGGGGGGGGGGAAAAAASGGGGGRRGGGKRTNGNNIDPLGDRTLAERMGL